MFFYQPFVLISDLIGHMVSIVLVGFVVVECVSCYADLKRYQAGGMKRQAGDVFLIRRRDHLLTLVAVVTFTIWIVAEYFAPIHSVLYHFFFHWTSVLLIVFFLAHLSFRGGESRLSWLFWGFVATVALRMSLDIPKAFWEELPYDQLLRSAIKLVETLFLYFFVVSYGIASKSVAYAKNALRMKPWSRRDYALRGVGVVAVLVLFGVMYQFVPEHNRMAGMMDAPSQDVTVRLKWIPQAQFAGMYVAAQKGHYKDESLNVSLLPFDYEHYPIDDVVNGHGTFGLAAGEELLLARMRGLPVVALAAVYQETQVGITVLEDSDIGDVDDLAGKRVGMWGILDDVFIDSDIIALEVFLFAHEKRHGHKDPFAVEPELVFVGFDGVKKMMAGDIDALMVYITDEPVRLEREGFKTRTLLLADEGIPFYGDVLFTTEDVIRDNPALVSAFVRATLRGWRYVALNPEKGVDATMLYEESEQYGSLLREHEEAVLELSLPLVKPSDTARVGEMDPVVWKAMYDVMRETGVLDKPFDVRDAYTTRFISHL